VTGGEINELRGCCRRYVDFLWKINYFPNQKSKANHANTFLNDNPLETLIYFSKVPFHYLLYLLKYTDFFFFNLIKIIRVKGQSVYVKTKMY